MQWNVRLLVEGEARDLNVRLDVVCPNEVASLNRKVASLTLNGGVSLNVQLNVRAGGRGLNRRL